MSRSRGAELAVTEVTYSILKVYTASLEICRQEFATADPFLLKSPVLTFFSGFHICWISTSQMGQYNMQMGGPGMTLGKSLNIQYHSPYSCTQAPKAIQRLFILEKAKTAKREGWSPPFICQPQIWQVNMFCPHGHQGLRNINLFTLTGELNFFFLIRSLPSINTNEFSDEQQLILKK